MQDDSLNRALQVDVLAAALRSDRGQTDNLIAWLAERFETILPSQTTVIRGGWFLSKVKHVKELTLRFSDVHFVLEQHKHGQIVAKELKIVREVVLKTSEVSMEKWIEDLARELSELAESNSQTRQALADFLLGQ